MKTSKLKKLAWVFIALAVTATSLYAQGRGFRNRVTVYPNVDTDVMSCVDQISGLSEKQISEITTLEEQHQNVMANLRDQRRSTTDLEAKDEILKQIDATVEGHHNEVMALLNSEQKEQYAQIQSQGTLHKYQNPKGRGIYGKNVNYGNTGRMNSLHSGRGNGNYAAGAGKSDRGSRIGSSNYRRGYNNTGWGRR